MAAGFTRSPPASPFWTLDPAAAACTVAYTPFDLANPPPASVSLADTWNTYPGTYLVLPPSTQLDATLAASLAAFRAGRPLRVVWVADPSPYGAYWDASWIAAAPGANVTSGFSSVALRNLALWLGDGCPIGPDGGGDNIVISARAGDPGSIYLTSASGGATVGSAGGAVTLAFDPAGAGCATTSTKLDNSTAPSDLQRLDVGMRIFATDPSQPLLPDRLGSWRYPVFADVQPQGDGATPTVSVSLHPILPLDPRRTYFALVPNGALWGPEQVSCYVTTNGKRVHLTPLAPAGAPARAAKLVLAVRALSDGPSARDPYYLVPSGAFRIRVLDEHGTELTGPQSLMCGTSGIEYILIDQPDVGKPGCELWFTPGRPALAKGKGLQATATTAYVSVYGPGGAGGRIYRAQADSAALFTPSTDAFMTFKELSGTALTGAPDGVGLPTDCYPMLAYTGIHDDDVEPYQQLEYQAVATTRRAIIGAMPALQSLAPAITGALPITPSITPQGLLADVDDKGNVVNLTLALSPAGAIELKGVTAQLAAALQSNQLFLVASQPETLAATQPSAGGTSTLTPIPPAKTPPPVTGEVQIPGSPDGSQMWAITAWPGPQPGWAESSTVVVLKFAGKPLADLVADTTTWAGDAGTQFNGGVAGVQSAQQIVQDLIDRARKSTAPEFKAFADLAVDPAWQGVLFLNAPVPPAELPTEIAGLAAGIDASAFKAHHIGLTVTPATSAGGAITAAPSSLFGLIFYESPDSAAGAAPPYAFNVLNLKVRFENSLVKTFASQIELLVDELFGEPATLVDASKGMEPLPENVLLLDGVYQQQGSTGGYTFTTPDDNLFEMTSAVLDTVDVAIAQFVTVVPPDPLHQATPAQSRFVLAGSLRFKPAASPNLDVFSFGPESVATPAARLSPERLFYSNLWINLDYVPNDRTQDKYSFDVSKTLPDPVQSKARGTSFFAGFPVTPTSFVQVPRQAETAPGGSAPPAPATPASLGFLGIGTDPPLGGAIKAPWFGIVADLGFGTAGALAAEVGFKASMLVSWSPGTALSANAGIGLKLPGTGSGGKLLSLQGVLKLKIGQLSLSEHSGTWVLELDRIALSVLMLTIPPTGQVNALLFADPSGTDHTTLGWYAGYAKTGGS